MDGLNGDDIADIIYTSGTTGRPKGVMMNHLQTLRLYAEWCDLADLREGDRYLIVNPFFHTFGYKAGCIAVDDPRRHRSSGTGVRRRSCASI